MSIDKSYSFGTHLEFMPAILTNPFMSLCMWYVQSKAGVARLIAPGASIEKFNPV